MMFSPKDVKIYLHLDPTDMRKSINTLSILVQETLALESGSGHLFLFCNCQRNKLKALYYEEHSFSLWYRRLETGKFIFPKDREGYIEITNPHFECLMASNRYSKSSLSGPAFYDTFA